MYDSVLKFIPQLLGEFYNPYVPEFGEPRYYQPPPTEYLITQGPISLEQQLPLRMQETSFSATPQKPRVKHMPRPQHMPRGMYFEQQLPRPSNIYSRPRKSPAETKSDTITEETGYTSSKNKSQETAAPSKPPTPSAGNALTSSDKSVNTSSQNNISSRQSQESKSDEDFKNYSMNESEARKLVSRVLERAKSEADT